VRESADGFAVAFELLLFAFAAIGLGIPISFSKTGRNQRLFAKGLDLPPTERVERQSASGWAC
jgi:hypothetical protein